MKKRRVEVFPTTGRDSPAQGFNMSASTSQHENSSEACPHLRSLRSSSLVTKLQVIQGRDSFLEVVSYITQ